MDWRKREEKKKTGALHLPGRRDLLPTLGLALQGTAKLAAGVASALGATDERQLSLTI